MVRLSTEHLLSRGTNRSSRHRFGIPFAAERGLLPSGHAPHSRRPRPRRACHGGERVSRGCASPPHTEFSRGCVARVPSQHVKCPRPEPGHFPRPLGRGLGPPGGESAGRGGPRTRPGLSRQPVPAADPAWGPSPRRVPSDGCRKLPAGHARPHCRLCWAQGQRPLFCQATRTSRAPSRLTPLLSRGCVPLSEATKDGHRARGPPGTEDTDPELRPRWAGRRTRPPASPGVTH